MSSCKYKFTYFNAHARGEVVRLVFVAAGVDFEDIRIGYRSEWAATDKTSFPFRQIPVLEIEGGIVLSQSHAIARYLANEFGLAGRTNMEKALVDMVADATEEIYLIIKPYFWAKMEEKETVFEEVFKKMPPAMDNMERLLSSNSEGNGFFVGDSLTWADLKFFNRLGDNLRRVNPELLKKYPNLDAHVDKIAAIPRIKAWLDKRPWAPF